MDSTRATGKRQRASGRKSKTEHVHVLFSEIPVSELRPSPENETLYSPIRPDDPGIESLAVDLLQRGMLEPIVADLDGWIASGHPRQAGAIRAGLKTVPARRLEIRREDNIDGWERLLVAFNGYREKNAAEQFREQVVKSDPEDVYRALLSEREQRLSLDVGAMLVRDRGRSRSAISKAKRPFLDAVRGVVESLREYWPLSDRQIHYRMLNLAVRIHSAKPDSTYANNHQSYRALVDILTRARIDGEIPFEAIEDPTRPAQSWRVWSSPADFVRENMEEFLKGYWRDPMQSQTSYIEVHAEKNTVLASCKRAAARFGIPVSSGRGFASIPCRWELLQRFRRSGKLRLVLLFVSDFDPEGWTIPHAFSRSLIDDFGVPESSISAHRVALNAEQVESYQLPPMLKAKESSANYARFVAETGSDAAYELESLPPDAVEKLVVDAIEGVVDREYLNREIVAEREDAVRLDAIRREARELLAKIAG